MNRSCSRYYWLNKPGLPSAQVCLCAVSEAAEVLRATLEQMGIQIIVVPSSGRLPVSCASHPDMLLCHMGGEHFVVGDERLFHRLKALKAEPVLAEYLPGGSYPTDISLNCLFLGSKLFGKLSHTDPAILSYAEKNSMTFVSVSQGYTRCSVCIVNENSIITDDPSVEKSAKNIGVDVLVVRPGYITLPGYNYGFIGGCSGLLGPEQLAFCGSLSSHPDGERIVAFARERGVQILELPSPDGTLWDIGGIQPLVELR